MAAVTLPNDVRRCPGHALIDQNTAHIYTAPSCEGCHRLIAARADTAAWIKAGRPTQGDRDRTPATRVAWMSAPDLRTQRCPDRIDTEHPHAVADERRGQEKSQTGCTRSGLPAA
jgi:hypothetical protein